MVWLFTLHYTVPLDIIILLSHVNTKEMYFCDVNLKVWIQEKPFGLAQAPTHFQQLINEALKGLPFTLRYLDDFLVLGESNEKPPWTFKNCVW